MEYTTYLSNELNDVVEVMEEGGTFQMTQSAYRLRLSLAHYQMTLPQPS